MMKNMDEEVEDVEINKKFKIYDKKRNEYVVVNEKGEEKLRREGND